MKITIEFAVDNAAFDELPASEAARIVREVSDRIEGGEEGGMLRDINGNTVGRWDVAP